MITNITDTIRYIGVDDTDIDLFESQYIVPNGISYNSYLIEDDKIAIVDTVDARKSEEWWHNLRHALGSRTPDYLIVHHMEPDHAGNIAKVVAEYPALKIVASARAIDMMPQFFEHTDFSGRTIAVKEGDTLYSLARVYGASQ
jgi:flavorubredoxin